MILEMSGPSDGTIEPVYAEIGRRVKRARTRAKITQAALAERTSLSRTSIANIERGEQRFMLHCLFELAAALRIPAIKLLPPDLAVATDRAETAIGEIEDLAAAEFIKAGLRKAKVLNPNGTS